MDGGSVYDVEVACASAYLYATRTDSKVHGRACGSPVVCDGRRMGTSVIEGMLVRLDGAHLRDTHRKYVAINTPKEAFRGRAVRGKQLRCSIFSLGGDHVAVMWLCRNDTGIRVR